MTLLPLAATWTIAGLSLTCLHIGYLLDAFLYYSFYAVL